MKPEKCSRINSKAKTQRKGKCLTSLLQLIFQECNTTDKRSIRYSVVRQKYFPKSQNGPEIKQKMKMKFIDEEES